MANYEYDQEFTAMSESQFRASAAPLIEAYRASFGKDRRTVEDARNALQAHCNAWAGTSKKRRDVTAAVMLEAVL